MENFLIDTHAHLDMLKKRTPSDAVAEAAKNNVKAIINVGSSIEGSLSSVFFSGQFENVFAAVGVHPHDAGSFSSTEKAALKKLISGIVEYGNEEIAANSKYKKIVAIGETGLDYFRNLSSKKDQLNAFEYQIELAISNNLPVIIHDRDAHNDTLEVIKNYSSQKNFKAVMHCFSSNAEFAFKCIDLGLFLSFTGIITFPNAREVKEAAKEVPIERIFLETDAPFLAPQPKRGLENYPENVRFVCSEIAQLKGRDPNEVSNITSENAINFFNLKIN